MHLIEVWKFPASRIEDIDQLEELLEEAVDDRQNSYIYVNGVDAALLLVDENCRRYCRPLFFRDPKEKHEGAHQGLPFRIVKMFLMS